jgi:hypothetical protein
LFIDDVGSRKVYENKGHIDNMPDEMSDIYVEVTRILQKTANLEGKFALNGASRNQLGAASIQETPSEVRGWRPRAIGERAHSH